MPVCTGNCDLLTIKGYAWDRTNNLPIQGVKISIVERTSTDIRFNYSVANLVSDINGYFYFSVSIDTAILHRSYLITDEVYDTAKYIKSWNNDKQINNLFDTNYNLNSNPSIMKFDYYSKTKIQLKLHRTNNDTFSSFIFSTTFDTTNRFFESMGRVDGYKKAIDTTYTFFTTYNIPTYIYCTKQFTNNNSSIYIHTKDSINCNKNGSTVYYVNY